ncbi:MAG: hypothetical protein ACKPKO_62025 [Candidatus Fonsibacter sp.]
MELRLHLGLPQHELPEVLFVIIEHTGLLQSVRQPPSEDDLLGLHGSLVEQTLQELVAQHPGAERQQQDSTPRSAA